MSALPDNAMPAVPAEGTQDPTKAAQAAAGAPAAQPAAPAAPAQPAPGPAPAAPAAPAAPGAPAAPAAPVIELPDELRQPWRPPEEGAGPEPVVAGGQPPAAAPAAPAAPPAPPQPAAPGQPAAPSAAVTRAEEAVSALATAMLPETEADRADGGANLSRDRTALAGRLGTAIVAVVEAAWEQLIMPRLVAASQQVEAAQAAERRTATAQQAYDQRADAIATAAEANLLRLVPNLDLWKDCQEMVDFVYPVGLQVAAEMGMTDARQYAAMTPAQVEYLIYATAERVHQRYGGYLAHLRANGGKGTPRRDLQPPVASGQLPATAPGAGPGAVVVSGGFAPRGLPPMVALTPEQQRTAAEVKPLKDYMADVDFKATS